MNESLIAQTPFLRLPAVSTENVNKKRETRQWPSSRQGGGTRRGVVLMFHGWAQNKSVLSFKSKNMTKRLCKAGYDCYLIDGPYLLPMKSNVEIDGTLVEIENGKRQNARAWFTYNPNDASDANLAQTGTPMQYVGLTEALDYLEKILVSIRGIFQPALSPSSKGQQMDDHAPAGQDDQVIVLGFSQGAVFCHILAHLAAQGHTTFSRFSKFILIGGFAAMHNTTMSLSSSIENSDNIQMFASPFIPDEFSQKEEKTKDLIDIPSLHIFGSGDTSVSPLQSEVLMSKFQDPNVWKHEKGHVVPTNKAACNAVFDFLDK